MDVAVKKTSESARWPSLSTRTSRGAWIVGIAIVLAACGGGNAGGDKITLGTGQSGVNGNDPANVDFPVFYVKRPLPDPKAQPSNVLQIRQFEPGADLYMRSNASPSAQETNLTGAITKNLGDVRDVDVSYDGKKVVFAMRFPFKKNTKEKDLPTWNIWEYDVTSGDLHRVITDDNVAEQGNDRFPHYLPDGKRIIFTSTRQKTSQSVLLDENKQQYQAQDENNREPASLLHVMDAADGGNLHQVSFNQSHDLDSAFLPSGQVIFSRWDGAANADHVDLYRMNPDGSDMELLYGKQPLTHATGTNAAGTNNNVIQFLSPRPLANGLVMALVRPLTGTEEGGDLLTIDTNTYVENTQATLPNAGMTGPAQLRLTPQLPIITEPGLSPGGRFRSVYPLDDGSNRLLVSWNPCRVDDNGTILPCSARPGVVLPAAPPIYGIWIYNPNTGTQLPIVAPLEGIIMSDVVAAAPRKVPPVILDKLHGVDYAEELETQAAGIINIKSVYDIDGADTAAGGILATRNPATTTAAQRTARFLRIEKAVSLPSKDVRDIKGTSFGPTGRYMREILGYAPIEPDGSVRVKVPANVAIQLTVIDRNARRISPLHRSWLQLRPGQVLTCNGCHNPNIQPPTKQLSHGRSNLFASVNPGAPGNGQFPATNTILLGNPGQTMAETRASIMCQLSLGMSACSPSVDVIFDDLWTDPVAAARAKDASFDYCYSAIPIDVRSDPADPTLKHVCSLGLQTPLPTPTTCETKWTGNCRIIINYVQNIQPLWDLSRPAGMADNKCTSCHSPTDAMNKTRVPAGQLDLSATDDINQPDHLTSYEKLLTAHNAQELNGNMLRDICLVPQLDANGNVVGCITFDVVSAPMAALNARGSRFFTAVNDATHAGFMTNAELRLISEWLDIGAQYYNNPFLAPVN